jgi:hypothetical protein
VRRSRLRAWLRDTWIGPAALGYTLGQGLVILLMGLNYLIEPWVDRGFNLAFIGLSPIGVARTQSALMIAGTAGLFALMMMGATFVAALWLYRQPKEKASFRGLSNPPSSA